MRKLLLILPLLVLPLVTSSCLTMAPPASTPMPVKLKLKPLPEWATTQRDTDFLIELQRSLSGKQ